MLARVGVKVNLEAETKATYFPKILSRNTSFYMLGWTPATYDSHNPLFALMATPARAARASSTWAATATRSSTSSPPHRRRDRREKRNAMIAEAFKIHADDVGHLPLHQQALAWGMKKNVDARAAGRQLQPFKWVGSSDVRDADRRGADAWRHPSPDRRPVGDAFARVPATATCATASAAARWRSSPALVAL